MPGVELRSSARVRSWLQPHISGSVLLFLFFRYRVFLCGSNSWFSCLSILKAGIRVFQTLSFLLLIFTKVSLFSATLFICLIAFIFAILVIKCMPGKNSATVLYPYLPAGFYVTLGTVCLSMVEEMEAQLSEWLVHSTQWLAWDGKGCTLTQPKGFFAYQRPDQASDGLRLVGPVHQASRDIWHNVWHWIHTLVEQKERKKLTVSPETSFTPSLSAGQAVQQLAPPPPTQDRVSSV